MSNLFPSTQPAPAEPKTLFIIQNLQIYQTTCWELSLLYPREIRFWKNPAALSRVHYVDKDNCFETLKEAQTKLMHKLAKENVKINLKIAKLAKVSLEPKICK